MTSSTLYEPFLLILPLNSPYLSFCRIKINDKFALCALYGGVPCASCGGEDYHMARDYHHIESLSDMFIIYLCRWESETKNHVVHWKYITTQVDNFENIRVDTETDGPLIYNVIAAVTHIPYSSGEGANKTYSQKGGHYIAYVKLGDTWYCHDDCNPNYVTQARNGPHTPRLLILKRQ